MIPLISQAFFNEQETKKKLANFILNAKKLSMDSECEKFENNFAEYQRRKHAILFNSGGSANLALLQSLKNLERLKNKDLIGFSAITFATNVMPIIQLDMTPCIIDCSPATINLMSENLTARIKETKISALFITNALGFAGDLNKIKEICEQNNIIFIEDNCESLGSEISGIKTGNFGLASTFSFFVAHHLSTIEGGMVCTDDEDLAQMLKIVRANGWDRNLEISQQKAIRSKYKIENEFESKYTFYDLAYNLRPTEITGFLGNSQLKFLSQSIKIREKNYLEIEKEIKNNDDFLILNHEHLSLLSSFSIPIICKNEDLKEKYINRFQNAGVEIRPMISGNIQRQPFYKKYVKETYNLPGAEKIHNCGFYFGNNPDLTKNDLDVIKACLAK